MMGEIAKRTGGGKPEVEMGNCVGMESSSNAYVAYPEDWTEFRVMVQQSDSNYNRYLREIYEIKITNNVVAAELIWGSGGIAYNFHTTGDAPYWGTKNLNFSYYGIYFSGVTTTYRLR